MGTEEGKMSRFVTRWQTGQSPYAPAGAFSGAEVYPFARLRAHVRSFILI